MNDENYYLIAYDKSEDVLKHYRVDKMKNISVTLEAREGKEIFHALHDFVPRGLCRYAVSVLFAL